MNKELVLNRWDFVFIIWFLTDALFNHSIIGMAGQLLFIMYSLGRIMTSNNRIILSYFHVFYLLFCFVCLLNIWMGYSLSPNDSKFMLGVLLRNFVFFFFLLQYMLHNNILKFREIFKVCCLIASIGIFLTYYATFGTIFMRSVEGGSINPNLQSVLNGFVISWMILSKDFKKKSSLILFILFIFIIISGTKKSILLVVVSSAFYLLFNSPKRIISNTLIFALLLGVLYYVMMEIDFVYENIGHRFELLFNYSTNTGLERDESTELRSYFIEMGMQYFDKSPILGNGINCFGAIYSDTYTHNNYVELLFSVGIIGTITYYMLFLIPLFKSLRLYRKTNDKDAMISASLIIGFLVINYAMVIYFERSPYVELFICYMLINKVGKRIPTKSFVVAK